jgi:hypothetical protein
MTLYGTYSARSFPTAATKERRRPTAPRGAVATRSPTAISTKPETRSIHHMTPPKRAPRERDRSCS